MSAPVAIDPDGDEAWDRPPSALETARYDAALRLASDADQRRRTAEAESAKRIFGQCLMHLTALGMPETKARTMLGRWRAKAGDDDLLVRIVEQAARIATPDPVSYVTRAIAKASERASDVRDVAKGRWVEIGWEAPKRTPSGMRFRSAVRARVWRDPFGKMKLLAPADGVTPPSLHDDPGMEIEA